MVLDLDLLFTSATVETRGTARAVLRAGAFVLHGITAIVDQEVRGAVGQGEAETAVVADLHGAWPQLVGQDRVSRQHFGGRHDATAAVRPPHQPAVADLHPDARFPDVVRRGGDRLDHRGRRFLFEVAEEIRSGRTRERVGQIRRSGGCRSATKARFGSFQKQLCGP